MSEALYSLSKPTSPKKPCVSKSHRTKPTAAKSEGDFEGVSELENEFLALFPHRFDYIYASHAAPGETPNWRSESRHPLSDRLIQQGAYLYGVRFGTETNYCLLDIDIGSTYHPQQDSLAIARIMSVLETIGLVDYFACTSSYSGGLHLYLPFQTQQKSWELAAVVASLLENAGFCLKPGQLEIFPNLKPYCQQTPSLFNAHRLPMQAGSYLLNAEFQPIWSTQETFIQRWRWVQARNHIDVCCLKQVLKQSRRKLYQISGKVDKFINDLNAEIEQGWTGSGQTNRLLGRLTMRTYIFHHVLFGGSPLTGQELIDTIVATARSLPGYHEYCQHQHELEARVTEWVACVERSRYFPYGTAQGKYHPATMQQKPESIPCPSWNQRQSESARDRIRAAIADLLEQNGLPSQATARFQALTKYGIGGSSLYRHRDLWHPAHLQADSEGLPPTFPSPVACLPESMALGLSSAELCDSDEPSNELVENPPDPPTSQMKASMDGKPASIEAYPPSLFPPTGSNALPEADLTTIDPAFFPQTGRNASAAPDPQWVQSLLTELQTQQSARSRLAESALRQRSQQQRETAQSRQSARMQQFIASGDPILVAEALAWMQHLTR